MNKEAIAEDFFILSTCLAGEVLQKFINYGVRFAIYGDFSKYTSKPLRDFMYESNQGKDVYFQPDASSAVEKLLGADENKQEKATANAAADFVLQRYSIVFRAYGIPLLFCPFSDIVQ